jgi:hypothetical protein
MRTRKSISGFAVAGMILAIAGCVIGPDMGAGARQAQNKIMLVRQEPPTLGLDRLRFYEMRYADLQLFLRQKGEPEFLAETMNRGNLYLILYYLDRKQAFACRTSPTRPGGLEFSGPYPITPGEASRLRTLR